jgi:hypothetical protein
LRPVSFEVQQADFAHDVDYFPAVIFQAVLLLEYAWDGGITVFEASDVFLVDKVFPSFWDFVILVIPLVSGVTGYRSHFEFSNKINNLL